MISIKTLLNKNKITIAGIILGAIAGFVYWKLIGCSGNCSSGACAITSNPVNSTIYGAIMLGLIFNMFKKQENKNGTNKQ